MWEREDEYKGELEQVILKAATSRLERLAFLALEDERTCYKHVMVLLEKQYRKCGTNMRGKLHLLYCISTLLRQSRKQQGARDRYAERLQPLVSGLIVDLRLEFSAQLDKLIKLWRMEGVFSAEQLMEVESGRAAVALRQPGLQSKSPSGSLTDASAQDPHVGFGDASGSGRSSAVQSHQHFTGGRVQPVIGGALASYQQAEVQDPYSADSNPNSMRGAPPLQPPPPPALPPPPGPPLIPPGLLGPVGPPPPVMLPQGSAAAAVAGLFPQGQLAGFLGAPPASLLPQGAFIAPMGPFGGGSMVGGMSGPMAGSMAQGMGVGVLGGGMNGGMPFQGPPGPMPPGLGLQRPPLYPQPPMYPGQAQGHSHGSRGLNRFSQPSGRMPPGLGPSAGPGAGVVHGQGHGWQGRYGQEGQGAASQPLPPPPPRPPPGSPPHSSEGRGSGTASAAAVPVAPPAPAVNGIYRGGSWLDGNGAVVPPGLGSTSGSGSDANAGVGNGSNASTQGGSAAGYIRPNGRRSRWERDSSDMPAAAAATAEPVPKRPALAAEGRGGAPVHAADVAAAKISLPAPTPQPAFEPSPPPPPPPLAPHSPTAAGQAQSAEDAERLKQRQSEPQQQLEPQKPLDTKQALEVQQQQEPDVQTPRPPEQRACRHAEPASANATSSPMDIANATSSPMDIDGGEGLVCGPEGEDVAVADGKADPDGGSEPEERVARGVDVEAVSGAKPHGAQEAVAAGKPDAMHVVTEAVVRPRAAEVLQEAGDMDDGGSSSAEAAPHHDSTAPATPGRPNGVAEQGESRNGASGGDGQGEMEQDEQQLLQQQRRRSGSGAGESGYDEMEMHGRPALAAVDGARTGEQQQQLQQPQQQEQEQQAAEPAKAAEAGMSSNQPVSAEPCDAHQRAANDVQSAEQPVAQPVEEAHLQLLRLRLEPPVQAEGGPEPEPAAAPVVAEGPQGGSQPETQPDVTMGSWADVSTRPVEAPPAEAPSAELAPEVAVRAEEPASEQAPLLAAASDGSVSATAVAASAAAETIGIQLQPTCDAKAPASDPAPASAAPPIDAPASGTTPQSVMPPPQVQPPAALHSSSALLLPSYEDSRPLEELELGDFDESWLE